MIASTDLYGLGVSLICLLTQTPPDQVAKLMTATGSFNFSRLVSSQVSLQFVKWLEQLAEPVAHLRFKDAAAALEALQAINIGRMPEARLDLQVLDLQAETYGQTLTQAINVTNLVPDTVLQGQWQVAPQSVAHLGGIRRRSSPNLSNSATFGKFQRSQGGRQVWR